MAEHPTLTLPTLQAAMAGGAAAIRAISTLQPAGGPGDKVFPPTYATDEREPTKYAFEERQINGQAVLTVLLDSVASQANRMEEALEEGWRQGQLQFPVVLVDFEGEADLSDLGEITTLRAPHRSADALLRDSLLGELPFRSSPIGRAITDARVNHATAMYAHCPTALVFGVWDSTGPKGGLGAKFQRALVSEIIGVGVSTGVKTASRIDPAGIEIVPVYADKDNADDWTADEKQARKDKAAPVLFERNNKDGKKGKPSTINHGNIAPSIDKRAGGVTMAYAQQTTVLSLPALRKLRFNVSTDGAPLFDRPSAEQAARVALAALGLAAIAWSRDNGYALRSRADLVPTGPLVLELVSRDGEIARYQLDPAAAAHLLSAAQAAAAAQGMGWDNTPVRLRPAPKLSHLIRQSRAKSAKGEVEA